MLRQRPKRRASSDAALKRLVEAYPAVELATLVDEPPSGDEWVHEIKFDGYRLLGFIADGAICLRTRNGQDWTDRFPAITEALRVLPSTDAVLDMEAVVLDAEGKSSFQALQAALGSAGKSDTIVGYVFDLLHLDGKDLTQASLIERTKRLKALLSKAKSQKVLRYSEHFSIEGAEMYKQACAKGLEGIISKRADAPYVAGRQKDWLKIKCGLRQEFIIIGYSAAKKGARALGALYLGYKKDSALHYAGKVGTGFTMKSARALVDQFDRISVDRSVLTRAETKGVGAGEWSAIHWVKPLMLCEVAFTEWTSDGRVRHPSFQGLREDKKASDVKQEKPLRTREPAK